MRYMDGRHFQLAVLGWVAVTLAPLVLLFSWMHGFTFPQSISETGTMANTVSFLLPFALGALALFSLTYALKYSYDDFIWDRVLPLCMFAGFTLVALFPTASPYILQRRVGVLPVTPEVAHIIHCIGAVVGFGAMITWILVCFTRSDKEKDARSRQKRYRNIIYHAMGYSIAANFVIFILNLTGQLTADFAIVFWLEAVILCGAGISCIIKSGIILKDEVTHNG